LTSDRVVVFAPNWLGDAVMALPAIADVRRHFASARLTVAARASVASLFDMVPGVDAVTTLKWRPKPFTARLVREDVTALRSSCDPTPGVGLLFPNSFATAWVARKAGLAERWGYATDWRAPLLTRAVRTPRSSLHQGRYYQHLIAELGLQTGPLEPRVDVPDAVLTLAREQLTKAGWDGRQPIATMAPGAAYGTAKRWLPGHFARVITALANDHGIRTVLVGSAADAETIRVIAADTKEARPIDLAGRTTLPELAGVIAVSVACVSNDSGAMHLAGAIGTPIVALFGPTRDSETAPLTRAGAQREVLIHDVWCRPCMLRECPIDHRCMKGLEPSRVMAALSAVIDGTGPAEAGRHD
jgi:heptosyltransferase-2